MRLEFRDGLEFLYSDSQVGKRPCHAFSLDAGRGSIASVQILLNDLPVAGWLRVNVRQDGRTCEADWYRLVAVPVEKNTGPVGFIEKEGETNPFAARRAPFRVFDAMEPIRGDVKIRSSTSALRLQIPIHKDCRAKKRRLSVVAQAGEEKAELALSLRIHPARVTDVGRLSFPYTNWFSLDHMATRHGLSPWSQAHWKMIEKYARLMARGRQNVFWCPLNVIFSMKKGAVILDRDRLRRLVKIFTEAGMHFIEGGHVAHRTGGEWDASTFDLVLGGVRATSVEGNALLHRICAQLMEEIDENGWRDRWIQHVTDEPTPTNAMDYRILAGMLRRHMPGIPLLDATMELSLAGAVDIWCPQVQEFQRHRAAFEAQKVLGDRVWFYTCCFPGGPWLNRLMDMELLRPCLFGWAAALFDLQGFLHWGLNHYKADQNPFERNVVSHGGSNFLPAGDTHIVYPGMRAPWSSVRMEAQREGFEDYELLTRLKRERPKAADRIIKGVIQGFDSYVKDVRAFRKARRALFQALDA